MTLTLDPKTETRLEDQARRRGVPTADYAAQLLEQAVWRDQETRRTEAIALLQSWVEDGDAEEQRETFKAVRSGLNAHHSSDRIIFP